MNSEVFQIPIASEIFNVFNFLVIDLLFVSFILYVTGSLAGYINSKALVNNSKLKLVPFNLPIIGGGLITFHGRHRFILILLRFSSILAAAVSTFGAEGRTETSIISRIARIRSAGLQPPMNDDAVENIQRGIRCGTWEGDVFRFGTMADDECYPTVHQYATIQNVSLVTVLQAEAYNCTGWFSCDDERPTSTYRCDKADLICEGVPVESGCPNAKGLETDVGGKLKCKSIVFPDEGGEVVGCANGEIGPESKGTLANCWKYTMKREDSRWWNETYPRFTVFSGRAVYMSANGIETRQMVELPGDERPVTIVTIWWVVSVSWLALVCVILLCAWLGLKAKKKEPRLHDAKSLVQMFNRWDYPED